MSQLPSSTRIRYWSGNTACFDLCGLTRLCARTHAVETGCLPWLSCARSRGCWGGSLQGTHHQLGS